MVLDSRKTAVEQDEFEKDIFFEVGNSSSLGQVTGHIYKFQHFWRLGSGDEELLNAISARTHAVFAISNRGQSGHGIGSQREQAVQWKTWEWEATCRPYMFNWSFYS